MQGRAPEVFLPVKLQSGHMTKKKGMLFTQIKLGIAQNMIFNLFLIIFS
jgi:hypothetical protein